MLRKCEQCYFTDMCKNSSVCKFFAPIEDDDNELQKKIEVARDEFEREWRKYLTEFYSG